MVCVEVVDIIAPIAVYNILNNDEGYGLALRVGKLYRFTIFFFLLRSIQTNSHIYPLLHSMASIESS